MEIFIQIRKVFRNWYQVYQRWSGRAQRYLSMSANNNLKYDSSSRSLPCVYHRYFWLGVYFNNQPWCNPLGLTRLKAPTNSLACLMLNVAVFSYIVFSETHSKQTDTWTHQLTLGSVSTTSEANSVSLCSLRISFLVRRPSLSAGNFL